MGKRHEFIIAAAVMFLFLSGEVLAATNQGRIWSSGFELNSLTSDVEIEATGGTGTKTIVTSPVRSGTYALQTNHASAAGWVRYRFAVANSNGPFYFRQYLRVADYPDSAVDIIVLDATGGGNRISIRMTATGALQLWDLDGTVAQIGSDSSVLSLNTWYRVELKYDASAGLSAVAVDARLDGASFASSSSVTNSSSIGRITFGANTAVNNYNFYWDDLAINTSTFPGEGKIIHLYPNAAGDNSSWAIGAGTGFNHEQVDEATPDDATTYLNEISSSGTVTDDYNITAASGTTGSSATISAVQVGVRAGGTGTTARTIITRIKSSSGGTVEESSSLDLSFNGWQTNHESTTEHNYDLTLYDLPGVSTSDWTPSALDSAQIGIRHDALSVNEVRASTIWLLVDYAEAVSDTTAPAAVSNLAVSGTNATTASLTWTSPGDDASSGTATSYDIRYSTSNITEGNWSSATQVSGEPTPSITGSSESMTVTGLSQSTTYYFAIKTFDEVPNESSLSNVPSGTTSAAPAEPTFTVPSAGSGGGVTPTSVRFSGQAYPDSTIEVLRKSSVDPSYVNVPLQELSINATGVFNVSYKAFLQGEYFFALRAQDKEGRKSGTLSFYVDFISTNELVKENLLLPPTISASKSAYAKEENLTVAGYAAPNKKVEIEINGAIPVSLVSGSDGRFSFSTTTVNLETGDYFVKARQFNSNNIVSNYSLPAIFRISSLRFPNADFNGDNRVNITDWSVFLFRWGSKEKELRLKLDMNDDGQIDITDFSVFLKAMKI